MMAERVEEITGMPTDQEIQQEVSRNQPA